ncbi:hypothetical protein ABRY23_05160 [Melioribacteraceae bacterium 4301-Me]|uniref:hypothetical protein n=1 Tax=Pyranulibacter aquaticus TaxID=3163344 RepID=UPI00359B03CE
MKKKIIGSAILLLILFLGAVPTSNELHSNKHRFNKCPYLNQIGWGDSDSLVCPYMQYRIENFNYEKQDCPFMNEYPYLNERLNKSLECPYLNKKHQRKYILEKEIFIDDFLKNT